MTRPTLYGIAVVAALLALVWLGWHFDPFGRRKAAETRAANAEAQSQADKGTVQALDRYTHETVVIREKSARAVEEVRAAPGADDHIPPEVLAAWRKGLGGE